MPSRRDIFKTNKIYHIFNKTIDGKNIFTNERNSRVFMNLLRYYRSSKSKLRYSKFSTIDTNTQAYQELTGLIINPKFFSIEILAYCLMPNHFHLLLKQTKDDGILQSMTKVLNAFTRNINLYQNRLGPVFLTQFKSRMITCDNHLKHVTGYIHLNPFVAGLIDRLDNLRLYNLSSYNCYISNFDDRITNPSEVIALFKNNKKRYQNFVESNAQHQKTLHEIKYAQKWDSYYPYTK